LTLLGQRDSKLATASATESGRWPQTTTNAPSASNNSAIARPIPRVPPVTKQTLFSNHFETVMFLGYGK